MNTHPQKDNTPPPEDELLFISLRAQDWDEFIGQETIKKSLQITLSAAKKRNEHLDHTLFYGPPGLGKTTLAHIIATEMESEIKISSGTALTKPGDLAAILTNLKDGDILFIDEIHRMPKTVEETLYPAMEDFALDIILGKGPSARTVRLDLPKFTLVGATTRFGALAGPFRDRFGLIHRVEYYAPNELCTILIAGAKKLSLDLDHNSALEIAMRSRGTPRVALKLLKRVRDYSETQNQGEITPEIVHTALKMFTIDPLGLDQSDRKLLEELIEKYEGGPVGINTIAAMMSEDILTIGEVIEPYLLQIGFLKRTPRGRVVTPKAYSHLGKTYPSENTT